MHTKKAHEVSFLRGAAKLEKAYEVSKGAHEVSRCGPGGEPP